MRAKIIQWVFPLLIQLPFIVFSQSIVDTRHNLSTSGIGDVKASGESEICFFCHTPHSSDPAAPMWNRKRSGATYTIYSSSTFDAMPGQPDGSSILCLSCHDGTVALGNVLSRAMPTTMASDMKRGNLTTDLSNDHPISFVYDASLANTDRKLKSPAIAKSIILEKSKVQCTSCHDPHNNVYTKFLRATNEGSELCFMCHEDDEWTASSHSTSSRTWNGTSANPWSHIEYPFATVQQNACENCHDPHNADGKKRLMKADAEEKNCFDCHNGNVAKKNIQAQFAKAYRHDVSSYINIHDPAESIASEVKHVECADCHNSHAANNTQASAPYIKGYNTGVSGIDQSGSEVTAATYEYEICYKCHAGNTWSPASATSRQIAQNNVRLEFSTSNPSFHPVAGAGKNEMISGLLSPYTANSIIYCSDCHSSNGTDSPSGPHGSIYPQILKLQYSKIDYAPESASAYALCYSCHDRNEFISESGDNVNVKIHNYHVVKVKTPCNTCHDPHGISSTQGNSTNNSHLINFNTSIVQSQGGSLYYQDNGNRTGLCNLKCHNKAHDQTSY